ncbi:MAG: glycoside hydrolase family 76 protein [Solirubrobacteraceae bacterium]
MTETAEFAERALRAHRAMEGAFRRRDGLYRRPGWLGRLGLAEHLWPAERAFVATLDLAGLPPGLIGDFDRDGALARDLDGLERYWRERELRPAYASDVLGTPGGGDRYYDDNAWMGLALVQLEHLRPGAGPHGRAAELFDFAQAGWDHREDVPSPGGVFWVEQGRGTGRRNHDRNTVSNAPNAELGLHLDEMEGVDRRRSEAERMHDWVEGALRDADGLYIDRIRGDGSTDRARWSYNQGTMIGASLLRARAGEDEGEGEGHLERAEQTARRALSLYAGRYFEQPPAFNAIFFRNLLLLHTPTSDPQLQADIIGALTSYAEEAWARRRPDDDLLRGADGAVTLLDQSALVSVLALPAWAPADYPRLA